MINCGDLVRISLSKKKERPIFRTWNFASTIDAKLVCWLDCDSCMIVISNSLKNPFHNELLRKVFTAHGIGYVWECEIKSVIDELHL